MKRRSSWLLLSLVPVLLLFLLLPVAVSCSPSSASGKPVPKTADAAPAPSFKSIDDRLQAVEMYVAKAASYQNSQTLINKQLTSDITAIKVELSAIRQALQRIEAKLK